MHDQPYPGASSGGFVPWPVYLDDRREERERLTRIESKLDDVLARDAREDGREVAETAAEVAVERNRRSRREVTRDVGLAFLSAALAVVGALVLGAIT